MTPEMKITYDYSSVRAVKDNLPRGGGDQDV